MLFIVLLTLFTQAGVKIRTAANAVVDGTSFKPGSKNYAALRLKMWHFYVNQSVNFQAMS